MASDRHKELCALARKWLTRPRNQYNLPKSGAACSFAIHEVSSGYGSEIADAFGLRTNYGDRLETVLVEVKVSRSDFFADQRKAFRISPETGMGNYRYYMAPEGLIRVEELPDKWGLIEVNSRNGCRVVRGHVIDRRGDYWFFSNRDKEITLCAWVLSKIGNAEKLVKDRQELMASRNRLARHVQELESRLDHCNRRLAAAEEALL